MHMGRGGWTWYTGSAGWMYRAAIETFLGLDAHGDTFSIKPCIPALWPGFSLVWTRGRTRYEITVTNPHHMGRGVSSATMDGVSVDPSAIPLRDDAGVHKVSILLGPDAPRATPPGDALRETSVVGSDHSS
jgi:cyclic beta-1,2-glucan synthetase